MKTSVCAKISCFLLLVLSSLFSCKKADRSVDLLAQAQNIVETKPVDALNLLDSIHNPKDMDRDSYMQYIVTLTQAKLIANQDVTNDSLIIKAQKYFNDTKNPQKAALANFYAGRVYQKKQMHDEAMKAFLQAETDARQSNNNILIGKSLHNIGFSYFERSIMDSSIVRARQALDYYNKSDNAEPFQAQTLNLIGRAYDAICIYDSALFYFDKSFKIANKINNKPLESIAISNIGVAYHGMKEYNKAVDYYHKALTITSDPADSARIYLNFSRLYNENNQTDSAIYYSNLMKDRLSLISDNHMIKKAYETLSKCYKEIGNEQKAQYYSALQKQVEQRITEANNSQKLLEIEKKYQVSLSLRKKELERLQILSYLYISIGISVTILIVLITWFRNKSNRLKHAQQIEKNKLLEQKLENLLFLQSIYQHIITEWVSIEEEVKSLAIEFGAQEEPSIYGRIRKMVEEVKTKTNRQLIENAKDYLKKEPFGEQAIAALSDKELLISMLSFCGYSKKEMTLILGDMAGSKNLHVQKLDIQRKLLNAGMSESRTNEILFSKNGDKNSLST
ncbi:tetratricopeptide repeat protein [Dysgonomonas sp. ZJ709]|uniref:tetratricopeptide repeat protein n=1 Tax=Dysgonomonas sp. ZJ709 TaxID=2709797 RepID=UPI0013EB9158|nr:tetratricopeptide repeat protein [Dysgonomonas sp. ZJ709]